MPRRRRTQGNKQADVHLQNLNITKPVTPLGSVPTLKRDDHGMWLQYKQHKLSRQNIVQALAYAAEYLHNRGESMTLVAVGGAVNTILLRSHLTTHDVDFFSLPLSGTQSSLEGHRASFDRISACLSQSLQTDE